MNKDTLMESIDTFQCPLIKLLAFRNAEPELISKQEVAEFLKISQKTVDRMVARGELKTIKIGKRTVRFMLSDIYRNFNIEQKQQKS